MIRNIISITTLILVVNTAHAGWGRDQIRYAGYAKRQGYPAILENIELALSEGITSNEALRAALLLPSHFLRDRTAAYAEIARWVADPEFMKDPLAYSVVENAKLTLDAEYLRDMDVIKAWAKDPAFRADMKGYAAAKKAELEVAASPLVSEDSLRSTRSSDADTIVNSGAGSPVTTPVSDGESEISLGEASPHPTAEELARAAAEEARTMEATRMMREKLEAEARAKEEEILAAERAAAQRAEDARKEATKLKGITRLQAVSKGNHTRQTLKLAEEAEARAKEEILAAEQAAAAAAQAAEAKRQASLAEVESAAAQVREGSSSVAPIVASASDVSRLGLLESMSRVSARSNPPATSKFAMAAQKSAQTSQAKQIKDWLRAKAQAEHMVPDEAKLHEMAESAKTIKKPMDLWYTIASTPFAELAASPIILETHAPIGAFAYASTDLSPAESVQRMLRREQMIKSLYEKFKKGSSPFVLNTTIFDTLISNAMGAHGLTPKNVDTIVMGTTLGRLLADARELFMPTAGGGSKVATDSDVDTVKKSGGSVVPHGKAIATAAGDETRKISAETSLLAGLRATMAVELLTKRLSQERIIHPDFSITMTQAAAIVEAAELASDKLSVDIREIFETHTLAELLANPVHIFSASTAPATSADTEPPLVRDVMEGSRRAERILAWARSKAAAEGIVLSRAFESQIEQAAWQARGRTWEGDLEYSVTKYTLLGFKENFRTLLAPTDGSHGAAGGVARGSLDTDEKGSKPSAIATAHGCGAEAGEVTEKVVTAYAPARTPEEAERAALALVRALGTAGALIPSRDGLSHVYVTMLPEDRGLDGISTSRGSVHGSDAGLRSPVVPTAPVLVATAEDDADIRRAVAASLMPQQGTTSTASGAVAGALALAGCEEDPSNVNATVNTPAPSAATGRSTPSLSNGLHGEDA